MFNLIKVFHEAKTILDESQSLIKERDSLPSECGLHLAFDPEESPENLADLVSKLSRVFPYRDPNMNIVIGKEKIKSSGNELENNINDGQPFTAEQWIDHVKNTLDNASPSLMTLKQRKDFWPKVVSAEQYFGYWCLNTHIPGYLDKHENGLGSYWEIWKTVAELIKFRDATTKPVIVTEAGNGQTHMALSRPDVILLYHIHKNVFGDRLKALFYYDSNLIQYHNALELLK